jgi:hypothetical protein
MFRFSIDSKMDNISLVMLGAPRWFHVFYHFASIQKNTVNRRTNSTINAVANANIGKLNIKKKNKLAYVQLHLLNFMLVICTFEGQSNALPALAMT